MRRCFWSPPNEERPKGLEACSLRTRSRIGRSTARGDRTNRRCGSRLWNWESAFGCCEWQFLKCQTRWCENPRSRAARHHHPARCQLPTRISLLSAEDALSRNRREGEWDGSPPKGQCSSLLRLRDKELRTSRWDRPFE